MGQRRKTIDENLSALDRGELRTWGQIGKLLAEVEASEHWKAEAKSFTEWLRIHSAKVGLTESSLWRYLSSSRYYERIRSTLVRRGIESPTLEELSDQVSPENLELLSKLARVAPDDVLQRVATDVLAGTITRAELRTTWQIYRPALAGQTARGRGVTVSRIRRPNPDQFNSLLEASILTALSASGEKWLGSVWPRKCQLYRNVRPVVRADVRRVVEFDLVAVVRGPRDASVLLHGIEIKGGASPLLAARVLPLLEEQAKYCDYFWLAQAYEAFEYGLREIPEYIGMLVAQDGDIRVLREARLLSGSVSHTGDLAKGLLLQLARR